MADPDPNLKDRLLNDLGSSFGAPTDGIGEACAAPGPPFVPDHTLLRRIGKGSYGEVWLARNALGTLRAVKIVFRRAFDSDRPYEREFAGIRRFEPVSRTHPSQLNVLHVGRDDGAGLFYYVMELADDSGAEGKVQSAGSNAPDADAYAPRTIRSEIQNRGRLACTECVDIGTALATALDHLHRHGLVHRDIKPSNIIFVNGIPKLADIGLVTHLEATVSFVGTEGYVPPEGPGTPQADIYSLGKVLYEMATGRDRQDYPELPTDLIAVPAAERSALAELNEVVVKACHPDAKERYQTAAELHADLALLQSGKSVSRMRLIERRLKFVARAGALVTAIAALAGAAFFYQQYQTRQARELAAENRRLAEDKSSLADQKTRLAENLARLGEENRQRIVRLDISNGLRLLEEGDPAGALLWFADALPLLTNNAPGESVHRIRIQQALDRAPRILQVFPHESGVSCAAFSPDGQLVATGTKDGNLRLWNRATGEPRWGPKHMPAPVGFVRFSKDRNRLFASSSALQGMFRGKLLPVNFFAVVDVSSGGGALPKGELSTNLIFSAFSHDDRWLAVAEKGHRIRVFDLNDGHKETVLQGHHDEVMFLSFNADGSLLASASLDRTVRIWRLPSGEQVRQPLKHEWPVIRAVLTDDGKYVVTVPFEFPDQDGAAQIQVWDLESNRRVGERVEIRDHVGLIVPPGSVRRFYLRSRTSTLLKLFDLETGREIPRHPAIGGVLSWSFSHDGTRLALGNGDHIARVFDSTTCEPLLGPFKHGNWGVNAVEFSQDEKFLLTGCDDGSARIWDLAPSKTESARQVVPTGLRPVRTRRWVLEFGRSEHGLPVHVDDGGTLVLGEQLEELQRFRSEEPVTDVLGPFPAPNGRVWVIPRYNASGDCVGLSNWSANDGKANVMPLPHPHVIFDYVFTSDSQQLISSSADRIIRFWRTSDGHLERTLDTSSFGDGEVANFDGVSKTALWRQSLPSGEVPQSFQFVDLEAEKLMGEVWQASATLFDSVYAPDGKHLAMLDARGPVTVMEVPTGRVISSSIRHPSNLRWVDWDPAGRRLLTMGDSDEVLIWDARSGTQKPGSLRTPGSIVRRARWSRDGRFIVAISDDRRVSVWDVATLQLITQPMEHDGPVAFAVITRNQRLITGSYSQPHLFRAWDFRECRLPQDVLADYARFLSGRELHDSGTLQSLRPDQLASLQRSLQARSPRLFP
jgi:WD40 repeat protein/serine/threonine protein kinase